LIKLKSGFQKGSRNYLLSRLEILALKPLEC
jgi:hypothetical protein